MCTLNNVGNVEEEFSKIDSKGLWGLVYQDIRNECLKFDYTLSECKKSENKDFNRYRDVSPYDHSRIVLSRGPCDYINANLIKMEKAHRQYILTQGPLPNTAGHFWLMVWEQKCKAVLMLNRIIEKNQVKCYQYWPLGAEVGGDDDLVLNDVGLRVDYISETVASYYTTRILRLTDLESGSHRDVLHFHYTTWPDFGVPESPSAFLRFLNAVRQSGALDDNVGPPVVHCSAGIGRSGTFCLVDSCLILIEELGKDAVKVRDILMEMRRFRMGLIQTPDQLRFSYQAIIEGMNKDWNNINDNAVLQDEELNENSERRSSTEEVPPVPPPRGESLNSLPPLPLPPDRPLPCEPPSYPSSPDDVLHRSESVRERKRTDQAQRTLEKVTEMKRKQKSTENWQQIKRSLLRPFSLSIGVLILGSASILAFTYFTNRV